MGWEADNCRLGGVDPPPSRPALSGLLDIITIKILECNHEAVSEIYGLVINSIRFWRIQVNDLKHFKKILRNKVKESGRLCKDLSVKKV